MLATSGEAPVLIAAPPARAIDTTGAGDAFCGAFMTRWLPGAAAPADGCAAPSPVCSAAELADAARFAVQVAATVVTRFGARPG